MKRRARRALIALGACWATLVARAGEAQEPPAAAATVELAPDGCEELPYDRVELRRVLNVELGTLAARVHEGATSQPALAHVALAPEPCGASSSQVRLAIVDQVTGLRVERLMSISDVDAASRPRALAIAVVELLQTAWAPVTTSAAGTDAPALPTSVRSALLRRLSAVAPSDDARSQKRARRERALPQLPSLAVTAAALVRAYSTGGSSLLGPELGLSARVHPMLSLDLTAELGFGTASAPFADANGGSENVRVRTSSVSFGPSFVAQGDWSFALGPRFSLGSATVDHAGLNIASATSVALGARAQLAAPFSRVVSGHVGLELGTVMSRILLESIADDGRTWSAGIAGKWLGVSLGARFDFER